MRSYLGIFFLRISILEAVGGGHNDGGVAADDGGPTPVPVVSAVIEGALPRQLVFARVHSPHNPGGRSAAS